MLDKIKLENFKCFKRLELEPSALNLFAGLNGMGKSTVLQALLLLQQSHKQGYLPKKVCLNGDYVQLGTGWDILYEYAEKDDGVGQEVIGVELSSSGMQASYRLMYVKNADVLEIIHPYDMDTSVQLGSFEYLNAERTSPQTVYPKSSFHVDSMRQLGNYGQYTIHYLSNYQDEPIPWDSCEGKEKTLIGATQYWLNEISPNTRIDISNIDNTDLSRIGYFYPDKKSGRGNTFRPTNTGFGVSYALPVLVALLKAKAGSTLIIENPEAHLHPKGQRIIGELASRCASNGIQVFIETHSDHVLNGIRVAAKKSQIRSSDIGIFFFQKQNSGSGIEHVAVKPRIDANGRLDFWPDGFFDEWEKALDEII